MGVRLVGFVTISRAILTKFIILVLAIVIIFTDKPSAFAVASKMYVVYRRPSSPLGGELCQFMLRRGLNMRRTSCFLAILLAGSAVTLSAAPIFGSFNIVGSITVTNTTITWTGNIGPPFTPDQATIGPGPTGSFAGLGGTTITIRDLNRTTEPVGVGFPDTLYITFDAAPLLPALEINFIFAGIYSSAGCLASPPAVGQNCTPGPPITPAASPFNFVNNPPPAPAGPQATATFVFTGETSDRLSTWQSNFTSQFSVPFQTVLAAFGPGGSGSVSNTYSATITVSPAPEPNPIHTLAVGLVLIVCSTRLRRCRAR
jgi:hypothetical protein